MRIQIFTVFTIFILLFTSLLIALGWERVLFSVGDFLVIEDELEEADLIHVIAGPEYRTDYAIQLFQQGFSKQIFFTGGWCKSHNLYHGRHGRELALSQGVPLEAIAIDESPVTSTYAEVSLLKKFIDNNPHSIRSILVVSDPFHMRRARWTYHQILGNKIEIQMAPAPFDQSPYRRQWWTHHESKEKVKLEYLKLGYYIARYQFNLGPVRDWLASLDQE